MKRTKWKCFFWLNHAYWPRHFSFLVIFCMILSCIMMDCRGRIKPKITTKKFLPEYMRSIYINHFVNKTSEMMLDIQVRKIFLDHYSRLNFERKKVPFVVERHHSAARLILMFYLNKVTRSHDAHHVKVDLDVSLKVNKKDQYLLKRRNFVVVVLPSHQQNIAQATANEIIKILDHFVETGVFVGKKVH